MWDIQGGMGCVKEMSKIDECGMDNFGALDSRERTIAIIGCRRWAQTAKQKRDEISKRFYKIWIKRNERPNVESVSSSSRNGCSV